MHLRPLQQQQTIPFPLLEDVLRFFFTRKRKSASHILNLLQSQLDVRLKSSGIESNSRPGNIATQQFIDLAKSLHEMGIARLPWDDPLVSTKRDGMRWDGFCIEISRAALPPLALHRHIGSSPLYLHQTVYTYIEQRLLLTCLSAASSIKNFIGYKREYPRDIFSFYRSTGSVSPTLDSSQHRCLQCRYLLSVLRCVTRRSDQIGCNCLHSTFCLIRDQCIPAPYFTSRLKKTLWNTRSILKSY